MARRVIDEAKEAAKEAAKRVSKEAAKEAARPAWEAAREAARPAREAAREAAFAASTVNGDKTASIVNGDVMRCGRAICQGTQKHTGASWTHQFGKRKQIWCTTCGKKLEASKRVVVAA
jgi:hypothetical protein